MGISKGTHAALNRSLKESMWSGAVFPFTTAPTPAVGTVLTDPEVEGVEGVPQVKYPMSLLELTNAVNSIMYYVGGTNTEGALGSQPYRLNFNSGYSNIDSFPPQIGETPSDRLTVIGSSYFDNGWKSLDTRVSTLEDKDVQIFDSDSMIVSDITVANTTVETSIFTSTIDADIITEPTMLDLELSGIYSTSNASDTFTVRIKLNGTTVHSFTSVPKNVSNTPVELSCKSTIRTIGASGTTSSRAVFAAYNDGLFGSSVASSSIDTTASSTISVTMQWGSASAGNSGTIKQGVMKMNKNHGT